MTTPKQPQTSVDDLHANSDLDSSTLAQHHSLGIFPSQATPGDHIHDGRTSKKLTAIQAAISVTGSRGGNAALASLLTALATEGLIVNNTTV